MSDGEPRKVELDDPVLAEDLAPEFELVRRIGEGGVADVFLAREVQLKRRVALKVLRARIARDETARRRFLREGRSAARISHPNVVAVHRVGTLSDDRPYLVMEYVAGRDLDSLLAAEGSRSVEEGREILAQLARGLQSAHDHGIVHRDVRPGNVLRENESGRIVLTDFGIAGVLERDGEEITRLTAAGERLGEMRYSSPEQVRGDPVTPAGDVYSLAVTGYVILTGRGPYEGERPADLIRGHLESDPLPLDRIRFDVDAELTDLLLRCLSKVPSRRPSAGRVAREIEAGPGRSGAGPDGAGGAPSALRGFLRELKRRHVYKVAVAYVAAAFLGLQALVDIILPAFPVPDWIYTVLVSVALAGFPVVLVLSWMYDMTSSGIRRTRDDPAPESRVRIRVFQGIGIVLSLALAVAIGWWLLR